MTNGIPIARVQRDPAAGALDDPPKPPWYVLASLLLLPVVAVIWFMVCLFSTAWLAYHVPLTEQDLQWASWLISYSTATHFGHGYLAMAMAVAAVLMGLAMAVARRTPIPLIAGLLMAGSLYVVSIEGTVVRVGLLAGHIKIGCYVYEMRECHDMFGLDSTGLRSRYAARSGHPGAGEDAAWYVKQRGDISANSLFVLPGAAFLVTPFYLTQTDAINAMLEAQRAEVQQYINTQHVAQSGPSS